MVSDSTIAFSNGINSQLLTVGSFHVPSVASRLQLTATPTDVGVEEVVEFWPGLVRLGWFLAGFLVIILINRLLLQPALGRIIRRRNRNNPTLQGALLLYVRLGALVVALLIGAAVAGYGGFLGDSALLLSAIALAIGVAAQEVIGSLVSGLALVLDPEFNVGDYIEWEGGEGVVQAVALRITRVKTRDGELVTIPNTILTRHEITRPFGSENYRVGHDIDFSYQCDLEEAVTLLESAAASTDGVLDEPPPTAYVNEFGDDAVSVRIHYWIDAERRDVPAIRSAFARRLKNDIEQSEVAISPPSEHELSGELAIDTHR